VPQGAAPAAADCHRAGLRQYNFLAIGFCSSERTSDCIVSLAVSPRGVALSFYYGATLPDPDRVLIGSGTQNRYVRLESAAVLETPAVAALIAAAIAQARVPLPATGGGYLMIKSVSANQRPRRKMTAAAPGGPRQSVRRPSRAKPRVQQRHRAGNGPCCVPRRRGRTRHSQMPATRPTFSADPQSFRSWLGAHHCKATELLSKLQKNRNASASGRRLR
jgi:hypothetical protein